MQWPDVLVTVAVSVASVLGTLGAARLTARSSDRATDKTTAVAARAADVDGFDRLTQRLEARLARVESEAEACRTEAAELRKRVEQLEQQAGRDARVIDALRTYVRTLRDYINATGPHDKPVPPAPEGLDL